MKRTPQLEPRVCRRIVLVMLEKVQCSYFSWIHQLQAGKQQLRWSRPRPPLGARTLTLVAESRVVTIEDDGGWVGSKEIVQGSYYTDFTCLYSAIAKPNMKIKIKKLSIF